MLILEIAAGVCLGILAVPALWLLATTIIYWRKERRWWCATVPVVWTASGENKLRLVAGCCNRASLNQITFNTDKVLVDGASGGVGHPGRNTAPPWPNGAANAASRGAWSRRLMPRPKLASQNER